MRDPPSNVAASHFHGPCWWGVCFRERALPHHYPQPDPWKHRAIVPNLTYPPPADLFQPPTMPSSLYVPLLRPAVPWETIMCCQKCSQPRGKKNKNDYCYHCFRFWSQKNHPPKHTELSRMAPPGETDLLFFFLFGFDDFFQSVFLFVHCVIGEISGLLCVFLASGRWDVRSLCAAVKSPPLLKTIRNILEAFYSEQMVDLCPITLNYIVLAGLFSTDLFIA